MKIGVLSILLGIVFIAVGYLLVQFSFPWLSLSWSPIPVSIIEVHPFASLGYILGAVGFVLIVFAVVQRPLIRFLLIVLFILFLVALFKGWIPLA